MRKLLPVALALTILGLAACSDDASVTADSVTTLAASESTSAPAGTDADSTDVSSGASTEEQLVDQLATSFAGGGISESSARCVAQGMYDALGAEDFKLVMGIETDPEGTDPTVSEDKANEMVDAFFKCDFLEESLASQASDAGVSLSSKEISCVAGKAKADKAVRTSFAAEFTGGESEDIDALIDEFALSCGISQSDLDKINAAEDSATATT